MSSLEGVRKGGGQLTAKRACIQQISKEGLRRFTYQGHTLPSPITTKVHSDTWINENLKCGVSGLEVYLFYVLGAPLN